MKIATMAKILATGLALFMLVFEVAATDPIFVKWLVVDNPGDETIRQYWQRAEAGELNPGELVDLGTMLFYRGWPNDSVTYFKQALDEDPELADAWFRTGLVKHYSGDLGGARSAYKKCLKIQSGHAWANFYLALLEEQTGEAKAAMKHYETAFKHAPELADPKINPEILSSRLQLGAQVRHFDQERFEKSMPMPYLEPAALKKVRRQFEAESEPEAAPVTESTSESVARKEPTPPPSGSATGGSRGSATRQTTSSKSNAAASGVTSGNKAKSRGSNKTSVPDANSTPYGVPDEALREAAGSKGTNTGGTDNVPRIGDTSPEASLQPVWPGLYDLVDFLV